MTDTPTDLPPPASSSDSRSALGAAGCVLASSVALPPLLYVGSYAYFALDEAYGWGVVRSFDPRTYEILVALYRPLICIVWLVQQALFPGE